MSELSASCISCCLPSSVAMETSGLSLMRLGQGPPSCARFSSAGGKQEKSRKSHAPANRF